MTQIIIPTYGFAGLHHLLRYDPDQLYPTEAGTPFIHFYNRRRERGTPMMLPREAAQLENRGVLLMKTWIHGLGYEVSPAGRWLLKAVRSRPEGWSASSFQLEDLLFNASDFVRACLCNMPGYFSPDSRHGWFLLFSALEITVERRRSGTVELADPVAVLEFFKNRPHLIPNEVMMEPSLKGRPSDLDQVRSTHLLLNAWRRIADPVEGDLTDEDWDIA